MKYACAFCGSKWQNKVKPAPGLPSGAVSHGTCERCFTIISKALDRGGDIPAILCVPSEYAAAVSELADAAHAALMLIRDKFSDGETPAAVHEDNDLASALARLKAAEDVALNG